VTHFQQRVLERFGLKLTKHDIRFIVKTIQQQEGDFVKRLTNRKTKWKIEYQGVKFVVVYNNKRHIPITAVHH
jgi:hypothetical protein